MSNTIENYVIKNDKGYYIGIDSASGGYPFQTESIINAKIWLSKEDAHDYKRMFNDENWTLHAVIINTIPTRWF